MNKHWHTYGPYAVLIYFFNAFLLPHGLLYSALLTPVFLYWLWKHGIRRFLPPLVGIVLLFDLFHWHNGAATPDLLQSTFLFLTAAIFAVTSWQWFRLHPAPDWLFSRLLKWNTLFVILALLLLPFGFGRELLWYEIPISPGIAPFPRLKLFTYEASYYALLFAPVFTYYFWRLVKGSEARWLMTSLAIGLPLLLSLSFGVTGALGLALILCMAIHWSRLSHSWRVQKALLYGIAGSAATLGLLLAVAPDNPVFERLENIFEGSDTSAKGRLADSFMFAFDLARSKSLLLGAGLGQVKIFAHDLIVTHYQYEGEFAEIVRIPNSMGEWLATFGLVGFAGKIAFELWLFFRFRLYANSFNLSLFLFIFIYQFTGSFLVNTAEILVWAVALFSRFREFDVQLLNRSVHEGSIH